MPNCSDCGHNVRAEERFCSNCSGRLNTPHNSGEYKRLVTIQEVRKLFRACAFCNGVGKIGGPFGMGTPITHKLCGGTGHNLVPEDWQPCETCRGTGKEIYGSGITTAEKPCRHCKGAGWASMPDIT